MPPLVAAAVVAAGDVPSEGRLAQTCRSWRDGVGAARRARCALKARGVTDAVALQIAKLRVFEYIV